MILVSSRRCLEGYIHREWTEDNREWTEDNHKKNDTLRNDVRRTPGKVETGSCLT